MKGRMTGRKRTFVTRAGFVPTVPSITSAMNKSPLETVNMSVGVGL